MLLRSVTLWISFCGLSVLCGQSLAAEPAKVTYAEHVLPLLRDKCLNCHNPDKTRGDLDLSSYPKLMLGGSSGAVIQAGHPDESRLYLLAAHKSEPKMPPQGDGLSADALKTVRRWIEQGALETASSKPIVAAKPKSEIALASIVHGRPAGPPPMPTAALAALRPATHRPAAVTALAASPWAPLVAVAGPKEIILFDADSLAPLGALTFPYGQVNVLKFSRNGQLLLAGGGRGGQSGKVVIWNVVTGKQQIVVGDEHDAVLAADISADQTQIALGGPGKTVRIYSTADGSLIREIKKHTDWVTAIEYSPDGVLLASGDRSSGLFVWEAHSGQEYFGLRGHRLGITGLSWRDDSNVLASCCEDGTVRLWEMENGKQIRQWAAHGGGTESVGFLHDGHIATCGRDHLVKLWDGNGSGKRTFEAFGDLALHVAGIHDNSRIVAGDLTGTIRMWSVQDGKRRGETTTNPGNAADRLLAIQKELRNKEAELAKTVQARDAAQKALEKANQELAPLQKSASETANIAAVIGDALVHAKAAADAASAALKGPAQTFAARDVKAKALAEAAAKLKDAAGKAADNGELKQMAQAMEQTAAQAAAERATAEQALAAAQKASQNTSAKLAAAQKAAADIAGPAKAAAAALAAKTAALKSLRDSVTAQKAAADRLAAEVAGLKAAVERIKTIAVASKS